MSAAAVIKRLRRKHPAKPAFASIALTVFIDILAMGLTLPVLPKLIVELHDGDKAQASLAIGLLAIVWASMHFACSPITGMLSDRYGRRPVILLSNVGLALDFALIALAPTIAWILVGRILSGAFAASFIAARAYIADITPPERRAESFSRLGVIHAFAFIVGPGIGGVLGSVDARLPFWIAAGLSVVNAVYGVFALAESMPLTGRRPLLAKRRLNPLRGLDVFIADPQLRPFAIVTCLNAIARTVLPTTLILYVGMRYGWSAAAAGALLAGTGAFNAVVQALLVGPVVRHYGERSALMLGLMLGAVGLMVLGLSSHPAGFIAGMGIMALWGLSGPAAQSLMTSKAKPDEQGRLQGSVAAIVSVAECIGPGLFAWTFVFAHDSPQHSVWRGAPFLLSAAILCLAALAATVLIDAGFRTPRKS